MGVLILDDHLTPLQYIAVAMVLAGIYLSQHRNGKAKTKAGNLKPPSS